MERFAIKKMLAWKQSSRRKPLILKGVRQVGKTWILKEFGKRYYKNVAYFNFDENEEFKQFFETTKDVSRILQNLMLASGQQILPGGERQKFCVHGIIGARQSGASNEHEYQTQFS